MLGLFASGLPSKRSALRTLSQSSALLFAARSPSTSKNEANTLVVSPKSRAPVFGRAGARYRAFAGAAEVAGSFGEFLALVYSTANAGTTNISVRNTRDH